MNLLLTSIGKRIELTEHLKSRFRVVGVDASPENPARSFVDAFYQVPRCREKNYVGELLTVCKKEEISLLIPLYEPEFPILDGARRQFEEIGVTLVLSEKAVLDICDDKRGTAAFFEKYRIPAPRTLSAEEIQGIIAGKEGKYPLVVKPADGMGSENIFFAKNRRELEFFYGYVDNALVQECAPGKEYTVDVLCDFSGRPVYIVPRIRLEVRAGEVTKSRVDLQECVIEETGRLLAALNREGCVKGPMTIQCFLDGGSLRFLEINPRFGGGVPLAFAAGADYAAALAGMAEHFAAGKKEDRAELSAAGEKEEKEDMAEAWKGWNPEVFRRKEIKELTMLRYTQAVYRE